MSQFEKFATIRHTEQIEMTARLESKTKQIKKKIIGIVPRIAIYILLPVWLSSEIPIHETQCYDQMSQQRSFPGSHIKPRVQSVDRHLLCCCFCSHFFSW